MRSKLSKTIVEEFRKRLKVQFPEFEEDKSVVVPSGCKVFVWKPSDDIWFYITLLISPKDDSFTIEIAWARNKLYPSHPSYVSSDVKTNLNLRFRLSELKDAKLDHWWYLSKKKTLDDDFFTFQETLLDEALSNIPLALDQVFEEINGFAMPYFEKVSRCFQVSSIQK